MSESTNHLPEESQASEFPTLDQFKTLMTDEAGLGGSSLDALINETYEEMRNLARFHLKGRQSPSLHATALVHEACMRLLNAHGLDIQNRRQFFYFIAKIMRNLMVEHARAKFAQKRGSGQGAVTLDDALNKDNGEIDLEAILPLHDALKRLEQLDVRQHRIVELRFFVGLNYDEIAEVMDISKRTAIREWNMAKRWLFINLRTDEKEDNA